MGSDSQPICSGPFPPGTGALRRRRAISPNLLRCVFLADHSQDDAKLLPLCRPTRDKLTAIGVIAPDWDDYDFS
jgi:hypothetical protein